MWPPADHYLTPHLKWRLIRMELLTTEGTLCAVKVACTVWDEGKPGDGIKGLPIIIRPGHAHLHRAVDMGLLAGCAAGR